MNVKRYFRGPLFWVLIVVVLVLVFSRMVGGTSSYKSVDTSKVVAAINAGNVKSALIKDKEQQSRSR